MRDLPFGRVNAGKKKKAQPFGCAFVVKPTFYLPLPDFLIGTVAMVWRIRLAIW